jgi:hypothetical protein
MTPFDRLLERFKPESDNAVVKKEAQIGDALLAAALRIATHETGSRYAKFHYSPNDFVTNRFMAAQITRDWGSLGEFTSVHAKGTAVECAIYRLYAADGWEAVLAFGRELVTTMANKRKPPTFVY